MDESPQPLIVDVISDVVCPWCYLGKRRLKMAIDKAPGGPIAVRWRPYQLDASIPPAGLDRRTYLKYKFPDDGQLEDVHARLTALGALVGISYDFDKITRAPNTLDAHRLIRWAYAEGAQDEVVERLFSLYFEEGRDIGDHAVLAEAARDCGMDHETVQAFLAEDRDIDAVKAEIEQAQTIGVSGVPFFIFASRLAVAGAQEVDVLVKTIAQARAAG